MRRHSNFRAISFLRIHSELSARSFGIFTFRRLIIPVFAYRRTGGYTLGAQGAHYEGGGNYGGLTTCSLRRSRAWRGGHFISRTELLDRHASSRRYGRDAHLRASDSRRRDDLPQAGVYRNYAVCTGAVCRADRRVLPDRAHGLAWRICLARSARCWRALSV
jgi:hypothetical protein